MTTDPASAGMLLRRLRLRVGLSQEALAELSGVTDRTIRGLELGQIKSPRLSTLEGLAKVLGLHSGTRTSFIAAWREGASHSSAETLSGVPLHSLDAAGEAFERQSAALRELMVSMDFVVGAGRITAQVRITRTFVALEPGLDRFLWLYGYAPSIVDPDRVRVCDLSNCRLGGVKVLALGLSAYTFDFGLDVTVGDTYTFSFSLDLGTEHRRVEVPPADELESLTAVRTRGTYVHTQVQFHPDARPSRVWQVHQNSAVDQTAPERTLRLSKFGVANVAVENASPGMHGVRWAWD